MCSTLAMIPKIRRDSPYTASSSVRLAFLLDSWNREFRILTLSRTRKTFSLSFLFFFSSFVVRFIFISI